LAVGVPSPKSQDQEVGVPVEVSVKVVLTGTVPDTGVAVNEATGAAGVLVVVWQVPEPVSVQVFPAVGRNCQS